MQLWIIIAILGHFLNAVVSVLDKHIVSNQVMKPVVYAFYSGIFQILYLLAIPVLASVWPEIAFRFPSWELFALAAFSGALFVFTLTVFYKAIQLSEVSRVAPIVGVSIPVFTYLLAYVFLGAALSSRQMMAFGLLVIGGFLMSAKISRGKIVQIKGMAIAIMAGLMFASYYVMIDFLFERAGFLDVFMILQFGGFLGAAALFISPKNRKEILMMKKEKNDIIENKASAALFIYNKITAAVAAILLMYAISIGDVIIINSLQSMQYVFVFILAVILSRKLPELFNEQTGSEVVMQKSIALVLIASGLLLIA